VILAIGLILLLIPVTLFLYAYFGYPALLWLASRRRSLPLVEQDPAEWPEITITLPVYNEERVVAATLESLLALDYPAERRHILVVSDASTDRTDEIVRSFASRGVALVRLPARGGKTKAENTAGQHITGGIVVSTDATIRIMPDGLKYLVRVFQDPRVGVASGRDRSVSRSDRESNQAESGYVGYEMWVRSLETRMGSIVGASGCFYAMRRELYSVLFPEALSRDFASALVAAEHGYRAVSVDRAVCLVPRTSSLNSEYRRKVRTMARGLETLWYKRRAIWKTQGWFAYMLLSHKLARWLVFLIQPVALLGLALLATQWAWAAGLLAATVVAVTLGAAALTWPENRKVPRPLALFGFVFVAQMAGFVAWMEAFRRELNPIWEPTRRN
jgi:cellulose synthase/poly-beta-1,6-N-acetylglucosamine synthase-like glycosyltransferase